MEPLTLTLILGAFIYLLIYNFYLKRRGLPPGPTPLPFLGNIHQVNLCAMHETLEKWSEQFGPLYTVWLGEHPELVISDFRLMKEYMISGKTKDAFTGRPGHLALEYFKGGKHGIFLATGPMWKEQRRFTLHALRDMGFGRNVMEEKIRFQADQLVQHISELIQEPENENGMDVNGPIQLSVASVLSAVLFGHNYTRGDERFQEIIQMLEEETQIMLKPISILLQALPWLRHIPLFGHFGFDRLAEIFERFFRFTEREISEHKSVFSPDKPPDDFISAYLLELYHREKDGDDMGYFSEAQLAKLLGDLLVAGMETTVSTLKYGILFALHNPQAQRKMQEELDTFFETHKEAPGSSMSHKQHLPYTAAFVSETQRVTNVLPLNFPHALTRDIEMEGYSLKSGTIVFPQIYSVHRSPQTFPEPERFNPERFLTEDGERLKKVEELVPFSVGKRNCVGESLAKTELFMSFAALFHNFDFAPEPGCKTRPRQDPVIGMVVQPHPFKVKIRRRNIHSAE